MHKRDLAKGLVKNTKWKPNTTQKFRGKCNFCSRQGHKGAECRTKKAAQKQTKPQVGKVRAIKEEENEDGQVDYETFLGLSEKEGEN